jgi:hypothetical protein
MILNTKKEIFTIFINGEQFLPTPTKLMLNKFLNTISLKERQIISLPGEPTYFGPALISFKISEYSNLLTVCRVLSQKWKNQHVKFLEIFV